MKDIMIGHELKKVSNQFKRQLDKSISIQLTSNQRYIMDFIIDSYKSNKDIFQKDIEKDLSIRRSTATVMLQTLEKNGFIKRESVEYDARLKRIIPIKILSKQEFRSKILEIESLATKGINDKDLEIFLNVLNKMNDNIEMSDNND